MRVRWSPAALFLVGMVLGLGCSDRDAPESADRSAVEATTVADGVAVEAGVDDDRPAVATTFGSADGDEGADATGIRGPGELVDATEAFGISQALIGIRGHAVAVADVNGDGWDDLFVGTFADRDIETYAERGADGPAEDRLLLGSERGFFLDESFEGRLGRTAGAAFADLDADGDEDLIVSRNSRPGERRDAPSEIYRNDGGTLVPATVLDERGGGRAIGIVDFDRDGDEDIVQVKDRWSGPGTTLFRNDGDLIFTDVTRELGFPEDVFGLGVGIGDLDGDGIHDLVVGGSNRWFLGDGSSFVEGQTSPLPWALHGDEDDPAHVLLADANGDSVLDIYIGQHFNSTVDDGRPEPVRLYLNELSATGRLGFTDVTDTVGLPSLATKSPQILLVDLDGAGQHDLITSATYLAADGLRRPIVANGGEANDGLPGFASNDPVADAHYWIDGVVLDANRDGRQDVFFVEWEPALSARLFLNLPVDP
ncbi:MAG: FG-GAP repeat domain-containing protein [Acidimicrobiales bacterium]